MPLTYKSLKEAEFAHLLGPPQAFNQKLKADKFTSEELRRIGSALGEIYESGFSFPDGTRI